jgi:hypothetical protein
MPGKINKSAYAHSGTKKHNKKHSENPNWKHKDRSAGAIIGRAVNTVKDTGEKIGKGAEKIYKDAKKTIKEGNKMSPYKLKPVPADKQKSLGKLPTEVRNKMGYQMAFSPENFKAMNPTNKMDSSHSFKMGPANNMKTMYMGSVYSMEHPEDPLKEGSIVAQDDELKIAGKPESYTIPGQTRTEKVTRKKTWDDLRAEGWSEDKIKEAKAWRKENPDVKNIGITEEKTVKDPDTTGQKQGFESIKREYQTGSNFDRRQQIRGIIQGERKEKRAELKVSNLENRLSKAKPGSEREKRLKIKLKAAKNRSGRIGEINRQTQLQEEQGLIGRGIEKSIQKFTPSVAGSTSRDTRKYSEQITKADADKMKNAIKNMPPISFMKPMNLSPKAMNYFNRKKK